ncbi:helix-turn-helix domain-containing protein, partial [Parathermosynechococcus lividus]
MSQEVPDATAGESWDELRPIKTTNEQRLALAKSFGCCRWYWNYSELCLFVVYEKRRRNGVSCWKRKKTRRGYTMSNDNVIAFQPTETVAP